MQPDEALARLRARGFSEEDAQRLHAHFSEAEERGKLGHGFSRVEWLETLDVDPSAQPETIEAEASFERWHGRGALGYLVLDAVVRTQLADPPERSRLIVCEQTFPTGMLGGWARRLAAGGLVAALTATSPARLGPPGGPKLAGTNPLAIGIPSSAGEPVVVDVSMGAVTWGDVIAGHASEEQLVPFGGEQWHKAFALALGLQLFVDALRRGEDGFGAVLLVARPEADPVPALRARGVRLPGIRTDDR